MQLVLILLNHTCMYLYTGQTDNFLVYLRNSFQYNAFNWFSGLLISLCTSQCNEIRKIKVVVVIIKYGLNDFPGDVYTFFAALCVMSFSKKKQLNTDVWLQIREQCKRDFCRSFTCFCKNLMEWLEKGIFFFRSKYRLQCTHVILISFQ